MLLVHREGEAVLLEVAAARPGSSVKASFVCALDLSSKFVHHVVSQFKVLSSIIIAHFSHYFLPDLVYD